MPASNSRSLTLYILPQKLSIARLDPGSAIPAIIHDSFWAVVRTETELSVVAASEKLVDCPRVEGGWRALQVEGPLEFALTGILASLAVPLAAVQVPIFALSTFDTDYILVQEGQLDVAIQALAEQGHRVISP